MEYMTAKEAAILWGVTPRRVQGLCKEGKIYNAKQWGRTWMIPTDAVPLSGKLEKTEDKPDMDILKKSPSLIMTDLYHTPGTAEMIMKELSDKPEAATIFEAELFFNRGELDRVHEYAKILLSVHSGFYSTLSAGYLLSTCAAYLGDMALYREARKHMYEAQCNDSGEREILSLLLALSDMTILETEDYPQWFKVGKFDCVTIDSYPVVKVQYVKYLSRKAMAMAMNRRGGSNDGMSMLRAMPYMLEPMIAQARVDRTLLPEIDLRLMCAVTYHQIGKDEEAICHIDEAIKLCLPDELYMILMEFRRPLDTLLDARLAMVDEKVVKKIKAMEKTMMARWNEIYNQLNQRNISNSLSVRERQVSRMAAFGMSNKEIGERLNISITSVKALISMAMNKTGAQNRRELGEFV